MSLTAEGLMKQALSVIQTETQAIVVSERERLFFLICLGTLKRMQTLETG